ncbi:unnamed protein product [Aureobasidium uvarum]|uniref:F-box domain-containing protein n=1 Tax=Aureobasidium uvarum TaxID=2773716 RepID=A0A9N8KBZ7_9PEZI|nr:unnamed protein product [Aureobasidium uvarum]
MPIIHDLPNELLLEILSYLDYFDVRDCSGTSRTLRAIAYHPALDHKMFRAKHVKHEDDTIDMGTFVCHPYVQQTTFYKVMLLPEDPFLVMAEYVDEYDRENGFPVLHARGHEHNATSPPVSRINFDGLVIEDKDKDAVTVGQVLEELVRRNVRQYEDSEWNSYSQGTIACGWYPVGHEPGEKSQKHLKKECKDIVMYTYWYN